MAAWKVSVAVDGGMTILLFSLFTVEAINRLTKHLLKFARWLLTMHLRTNFDSLKLDWLHICCQNFTNRNCLNDHT